MMKVRRVSFWLPQRPNSVQSWPLPRWGKSVCAYKSKKTRSSYMKPPIKVTKVTVKTMPKNMPKGKGKVC